MSYYTCVAPGCTRGTVAHLSACSRHRNPSRSKPLFHWISEFRATRAVRRASVATVRTKKSPFEDDDVTHIVVWSRPDKTISRTDGPTKIGHRADGSIAFEEWWLDGELHREEDRPAVTRWAPDGTVSEEAYYRHGKKHRIVGPALIEINEHAHIETYYRHGQVHRVDGPARKWVTPDGFVDYDWSFVGMTLRGPKDLGRFLRNAGLREPFADLIRESSYRSLFEGGVEVSTVVDALSVGVWSHTGIRQIADGAPADWVAAFEQSEVAS